MRIAVTGSSGMIGTALVRALRNDGHEVIRLVRHSQPGLLSYRDVRFDGIAERHWTPFGDPDPKPYEGCDVVVHLAGAGLGDKRWSAAYKREIRESRVHGTDTLARSLALCADPPKALLSASAIGWYGDTGDAAVTEEAPAADDFLGALCRDWEAATRPAEDAGIAVTHLRNGVVLDKSGGALARMLPPFRLGVGGPIAGGRQWFSFIGMGDYLAALAHVMTLTHAGRLTGAVNVTGPAPVTNRVFTRELGAVLHRPTVLPIPGLALRVLYGPMAGELTGSQRVLPARLLDSGFEFGTPDARSALSAALRG
jgi:uncharacterized protein (TIGR01777 family)